ncbi:PREDICTED: LOB domain-containing protein 20-like [Ipomoea nil]|uniref:LOB domain-containing protein 20-like n=1 Tax=Ipomoea nil TaxID=35883 RepID=UPI000900E7FB|nr:PREDICTED: LOB domain-containing protein 20-like [Ipomoea nil]
MDAQSHPHSDGGGSSSAEAAPRRKCTGKRAAPESGATPPPAAPVAAITIQAPCGACKFLRRKCVSSCIFAPHFGSDQGAARFAAVHKVFGASNVSKLLLHIPANRRHDAVVTISYEAQARLSDPVYGCVSTILALQQQVASLQAELAMVQTQIMNSRFAVANALQTSQQQQQQQQQQHAVAAAVLQPAYSNTSSASNNLLNISNFSSNFDLVGETTGAPHNSHCFDPIVQLSHPSQEEEEDEEQSHNPIAFTNHMFR